MAEIFHLFNIKTKNLSKIYDAITTQEGLSSWWTVETTAEPDVGTITEFRFTENYKTGMKIIKLDKDKKVEWECIEGDEQWLGTKIKFELKQNKDSIDVKFYHRNWNEVTDLFGICNYHWGLYMKSLKSYVEEGKGNPHKPNLS
jgi:uncharacterized protein YndB with AHSA1/START domain